MPQFIYKPSFVRSPMHGFGTEEDTLYLTHEAVVAAWSQKDADGNTVYYTVGADYGTCITIVDIRASNEGMDYESTIVLHKIDREEVVRKLMDGEEFDPANVLPYDHAHRYGH